MIWDLVIAILALVAGMGTGILITGFVSNHDLYRAHQKGKVDGLRHREELIHQMQRRIDHLESVTRRMTFNGGRN